jgi:hypothetical protein
MFLAWVALRAFIVAAAFVRIAGETRLASFPFCGFLFLRPATADSAPPINFFCLAGAFFLYGIIISPEF